MKKIIGFEVELNEQLKDWGLKLRYIETEFPDVLQVKYIRYKDLMSMFSYLITLSGTDKPKKKPGFYSFGGKP